jgi:putative tryptophan/tyrosine transport system substrate-binding protein
MRRRAFIGLLGAAAAWPLAARSQPADRMRKVGVLLNFSDQDPEAMGRVAALRQGLENLGWSDGQNVKFECRFAAGDLARMRAFARELVDLQVDVAVTNDPQQLISTFRQTGSAIPIVFAMGHTPILVELGLITSLSHPGGNMTGFTTFEPSIVGKWLELLTAVAPGTGRVGILFKPDAAKSFSAIWLHQAEVAASTLSIDAIAVRVDSFAEMTDTLATVGREPGTGLIVLPDMFTVANYPSIAALTAQHHIPACYPYRYFATHGGLMSYGPNGARVFRQAATYVDRVLRGANPGDLPIQQPNAFELVINLKTAKAMDLTVPAWLLARADEVIE